MATIHQPPSATPAPDTSRSGGEVPEQRPLPTRLRLAEGLVGLPALRRFRVQFVGDGLLALACLDDRTFAVYAAPLALVDPAADTLLRERHLAEPGDAVLVLLAAHGEPPVVTANLAGPIVVGA